MDIEKHEWKTKPPQESMTSLAAFTRDFVWRFPRERRDMVWDYCRTAPNLTSAVMRACNSRTPDGKMHNHQSRVTQSARDDFYVAIMQKKREIMRILNRCVHPEYPTYVDGFDALHDLFDEIKPYGIGPVTVYDVATRVGVYLGIHPTSLYLHAGVRQGIRTLCWAMPSRVDPRYEPWKVGRISAVNLHKWWPEFSDLPPDEVEDLLCTYRSAFMLLDEGGEPEFSDDADDEAPGIDPVSAWKKE